MTLTRRNFSLLLLASSGACFADFTLGREAGGLIFDAPNGSIEVLLMQLRLVDFQVAGEGPRAPLNIDQPGPWSVDPLLGPTADGPAVVALAAGDWQDLAFTATCEPQGNELAVLLEARFRPDDGGPTRDLRLVVDDPLVLGGERMGSTRYNADFEFELVAALHPSLWFPNVNVSNLEPNAQGWIELRATENPVVYAQLVDALVRESREWFNP